MGVFMGGSAYAMANQIAEGYILVSASSFRRYTKTDIKTLQAEIDRLTREIRGDQPPMDDLQAIQKKNRKLGRLNQTTMILRTAMTVKK